MDKSKLIWGIICLVIAGVMVVVNLTLPPGNVVFHIGDINMPWVPPVVLGMIGITLLAIMNQPKDVNQDVAPEIDLDPQKAALNKRLETTAWGFFLVLLGAFMFVPEEIIKGGWWSICVGLIFLGFNAARYFSNLRMSGFTTALGIISITGGILDLVALEGITGSILFIVLGAYLIVKPYLDKRQLFGKVDQK